MDYHPPLPKDSEVEEAFMEACNSGGCSDIRERIIKVKRVDKSKITFPTIATTTTTTFTYGKKNNNRNDNDDKQISQEDQNDKQISQEDQNKNLQIIEAMSKEERQEEIETLRKTLPPSLFKRWSSEHFIN